LENGFIESFNSRLRDELLDGEIFYALREAQIIIESCDVTTTRSGRMPRLATVSSTRVFVPLSPHGRLRNPNQLRRPCSRWCRGTLN